MVTIMYKCCIFDLDGTLVNSIYAIQKSVNDTLSYWNMREISVEESRLYVETVIRSCWSGPLSPAGIRSWPIMMRPWIGIRIYSGNAACTVWRHTRVSGSFWSS